MSKSNAVLATEVLFGTPMGEDAAKFFFKKHRIKKL